MSKSKSKGRPVNGILLLDKPYGRSSNAVLQYVKRIFQARKAGHTGSLDPLATGMLPICFGEATKVSAFLLDADKHYTVTAKLGITTTTGDMEGEILQETSVPADLSFASIARSLEPFCGEIEQIPPMYSALKYNGQPLYKLARKGQQVDRDKRQVSIHRLTLDAYDQGVLKMTVICSKGTYIRTLVEDIGESLGCGAHVTALHRVSSAPFHNQPMYSIDALESAIRSENTPENMDNFLLPIDSALPNLPAVTLSNESTQSIQHGQAVTVAGTPSAELLRLYSEQITGQQFIGIGKVRSDGRIVPKRLIFC